MNHLLRRAMSRICASITLMVMVVIKEYSTHIGSNIIIWHYLTYCMPSSYNNDLDGASRINR